MSPGAYYAAPEGGGPARLLAIVAVAVVVGGGGIWLARTKPWLPPAEPQEEEAQEAAAVPAREIALPIAPPAPEEEDSPSPVPVRAEAPALPVVFVEAFACRAVESNSSWMAVAFQVSIGTSDAAPTAGMSAYVSALDADGFMLENKTLYNVGASPANATLLQDRMLVTQPQATRVASCKVEIRSAGGATLDSSTAAVEMAIPPPRQQQSQATPIAPSRPAYTSRPAAKVWGEPKVHRYGSRAVVSFRIWNQGSETISSNVDVELYLNGEFVDSAGELVEVAPGDKRLFEVTFDGVGQGGRATASVRVQ